MILSGNDFVRTSVRVLMLKGRTDRLRLRVADLRKAASTQEEIERVEKRIDELNEQLRSYLNLRSGNGVMPEVVSLIDLPERLIQRRIGLGLTQAELGDASGQTRQCISRYERTLYASASLARLIQIDSLLHAEELRQRPAHSDLMISL